jgi:hypothetical protein
MPGGGKKRGASSGKPADFWKGTEGWTEVEAGEEFLLGAEEGGFAGLEVLDGAALGEGATACTPRGQPPSEHPPVN